MSETVFFVLFGSATNVLLAAAIGWTTWAAAFGALGSNPLAGIRTWDTARDENAWRAAHRAAWPLARFLTVLCLGAVVLALALLAAGQATLGAWVSAIPVVVILASLWPLLRTANEAARNAPLSDPSGRPPRR